MLVSVCFPDPANISRAPMAQKGTTRLAVCHNSPQANNRSNRSEQTSMSSPNLVWQGGGLASIVAGILLLLGHLPRWAGILLIVGNVVVGAASFSGSAALIVEVVGALITCAAFVLLGLSLLSGASSGVPAGRPARVS